MKKKLVKVLIGMMIMLATTACGKNEETAVDTNEVAVESLVSEENNSTLEEAQKEATASDFEFEEEDGVLTLIEYTGTAAKVTVPDSVDGKSVVAIGERSFSQNDYIEEVILPDSVIKVEEAAFLMCKNLVKVTLGANTESLGLEAFEMSNKLTTINLPDSIKEIGDDALGCYSLSEVTIPANLTVIPLRALAGSGVKKIVIPGNVKEIQERAFENCEKLEEVEIQEGVESIGYGAFGDNDSLISVILPNSVSEIGDSAFFTPSATVLTITAPAGSYAEQYAKENDIPCITQ